MRSGASLAGRIAAIGAVVAAIVIVAILLFRGGGGYSVTAEFQNAAQLVKGNQVTVGGTPVGSVEKIEITDDSRARVELSIKEDGYDDLPVETEAVIRQASQSGIANRYVELQLPPDNKRSGKTIADGGKIEISQTTTAVELDELFNTLDPDTRDSISAFFKNSAKQFKGKEEQQREVYRYLNPALSTSSRLFNELNKDSPLLANFLQDSEQLVTALAEKRDDLSALIGNANRTFRALGNERAALGEAIARFPDFMRTSNTTFVNLRAALDDVDPLVDASKPAARALRPFLAELRPLVADARPTIRDLSNTLLRRGPDNDLLNLQTTFPALASTALDTKERRPDFGGGPQSVGEVKGAFPATVDASNDAAPIIAFGRPYTPELMGWFDDFSTTGPFDAGGGFSRAQIVFNLFNFSSGLPLQPSEVAAFEPFGRIHQFKRCPGSAEEPALDGSNVLSAEEQQTLDCKEEDRATGPVG
ncbi:MAG TPA: MlaD family protein [Thermoleophilaceae bacterium]|jgi:phospholipid/cholesterol/gamma-HCH transport system substrate-binding protein